MIKGTYTNPKGTSPWDTGASYECKICYFTATEDDVGFIKRGIVDPDDGTEEAMCPICGIYNSVDRGEGIWRWFDETI